MTKKISCVLSLFVVVLMFLACPASAHSGRTDSSGSSWVDWESSDESVVRVSSSGVLTAVVPGKATITDDGNFNIDLAALSDDELHALQSAISAELKDRREGDFYENGELAYVDTEWGNYYFGVTKATILPKNENRDAVYQITWECQNESFRTSSGDVLRINEYALTVTDSNGYRVSPMLTGWDGEWENSYASVAPGKKCATTHTFKINDPSCEYLDVSLDSRGINCRIYITDTTGKASAEPIKEIVALEYGEPITITNSDGSFKFAIDGAHIVDWPYAVDDRPGTIIVTLQGIVENIDYDGIYGGSVCAYEVATQGIIVTDQEGFALEFYDVNRGDDGVYEVGSHIKIGTKKRVSLPFYANTACDTLIVMVGDSAQIEIPLIGEGAKAAGNSNAYTDAEISAIVDEILQYKNADTDKAWELIETYSSFMSSDQIEKVLLSYGRWKAVEVAENELKTYLKSPRSYYRYSGSVGSPSRQSDGKYKVVIDLEFGATNSFGGEITDDVTMYAYFTIDVDSVDVRFSGAELSAMDLLEFMD